MSNGDRYKFVPVSFAEGRPRSDGNDVGGFGKRLSRIEKRIKHLATSKDLQKVRGELGIVKWMLGVIVLSAISVSIGYLSGQ